MRSMLPSSHRGRVGCVGGHLASSSRSAASSSKEKLPPHLQAFVDAYDRKRAEEMKYMPAFLQSSKAGALGVGVALVVMYWMQCSDDTSSTLHRVTWPWLLKRYSAEDAHKFLLKAAQKKWLPRDYDKDDPYMMLHPRPSLKLNNPVGLASGFDTQGVVPVALFNVGFGSLEVGPFDVDSSEELQSAREQLSSVVRRGETLELMLAGLGVLGAAVKGSHDRVIKSVKLLGPYLDYLAITAPLSTDKESLRQLMTTAKQTSDGVVGGGPHIFLKVVVPEQDRSGEAFASLHAAATAALAADCTGIVISEGDTLSDAGKVNLATLKRAVSVAYQATEGQLVILAASDIRSGCDAVELIEAGASGVQISAGLLSEGPYMCRRMKTEVCMVLRNQAHATLEEAVGREHRNSKKGKRPKNPWARGSTASSA